MKELQNLLFPYLCMGGILSFFLGASICSAATCFFSRKKTGESWAKGKSHCDNCNHELNALDLVPVFGYLMAKGKCRYCGATIPSRCLYGELLSGIGGVFLFIFIFQHILPH